MMGYIFWQFFSLASHDSLCACMWVAPIGATSRLTSKLLTCIQASICSLLAALLSANYLSLLVEICSIICSLIEVCGNLRRWSLGVPVFCNILQTRFMLV